MSKTANKSGHGIAAGRNKRRTIATGFVGLTALALIWLSATEAKAVIRHLADVPVLVISDFHLLDGSTGVEAVSDIRDYYEQMIPAFIVSGDTSKVVKDARPLENCTLMSKPVNTNRLLIAARAATKTGFVPQD